MQIKRKKAGRPARPVRDMSTGKLYPSVSAAGEELGVCASYVSLVLNGRRPVIEGHHLAYEDGHGLGRHLLSSRASGRRTSSVSFPLSIEKVLYDRLIATALKSGESGANVATQAIEYFLDALESGAVVVDHMPNEVGKPGRPVIELTTNLIFESALQAARHFKTSASAIRMVANGHHKNRIGLVFKYFDEYQKLGSETAQ